MSNESTKTNQITEGVIWKQLLIFFFPIVVGTLFQQLYNTVDAASSVVLSERAHLPQSGDLLPFFPI